MEVGRTELPFAMWTLLRRGSRILRDGVVGAETGGGTDIADDKGVLFVDIAI